MQKITVLCFGFHQIQHEWLKCVPNYNIMKFCSSALIAPLPLFNHSRDRMEIEQKGKRVSLKMVFVVFCTCCTTTLRIPSISTGHCLHGQWVLGGIYYFILFMSYLSPHKGLSVVHNQLILEMGTNWFIYWMNKCLAVPSPSSSSRCPLRGRTQPHLLKALPLSG